MSYEYLNARVRHLKAKLLRPEQFQQLLGLRTLDEFIQALAETDYGPEIERSSVQFSGYALVEDALVQHTQRVFRHLYDIAFDEAKALIRLLLERFEVFNLKTILRGFHVGADPEETARSLFPTILYPTAFYQELLKREGVAAVVDYLMAVGNRFYKPLAQALPEYEAGRKLTVLESALDAFYFGSARQALQEMGSESARIVRRLIGTEVDVLNLVYAMRVVEAGVESEEKYRYILPGGERLQVPQVRDLLASPDKRRDALGRRAAGALGSLALSRELPLRPRPVLRHSARGGVHLAGERRGDEPPGDRLRAGAGRPPGGGRGAAHLGAGRDAGARARRRVPDGRSLKSIEKRERGP